MSNPFDDEGRWRESESARCAAEAQAANEEAMTTPEPLLELTEEEWEWVKVCLWPDAGGNRQAQRLIDFLLRLEAGRQQLKMYNQLYRLGRHYDKKLERTDADWLAAVRKERMGE